MVSFMEVLYRGDAPPTTCFRGGAAPAAERR
jgi:hypothetical protein